MAIPERRTHLSICPLCEAACGVRVEVEGGEPVAVAGDPDDWASRGHVCPKVVGMIDIHRDPDRLRSPLRREGDRFVEVSWETALGEIADRLDAIRRRHGKDAVAVYQGNPTAHNLGLLTFGQVLLRNLGTRNLYSATSTDQLPHMLASLLMFGHALMLPVPDVDRTDLFVIMGANPVVSGGSLMTAPGMARRIAAIQARGGRVIVIDPRRTETAAKADEHLFIRPGTDALLLLALLHVGFAEDRVDLGRLAGHVEGVTGLRRAAERFSPEKVAGAVGIEAERIRELARDLAATERAVVYGRIGVCQQEFAGLAAWLVNAVNLAFAHFDRRGGAMFATPAIDLARYADWIKLRGSYDTFRSRVRGLPEFSGELPVAALAEEIETPGEGQVRALITSAGNPVLSTPNGRRLERALPGLELMVSIDIYLNETTRHAHYILPGTSPLERDHYDLALGVVQVRNGARYAPPVLEPPAGALQDWEICLELGRRIFGRGRVRGAAARAAAAALRRLGPRGILEIGLRAGPYPLSLGELERHPHGVDLGALRPRLPEAIYRASKTIDLAPAVLLADLPRLEARLDRRPAAGALELIGRRQLRSNNSWMHNSRRLVKGKPRCTLLIHPADAARRGLGAGDRAVLGSRVGEIEVDVEITDEVMEGVVSLPHGWGHDRPGTRLSVASQVAGVSVNDITDELALDPISGNAALTGIAVEVRAAATKEREASA